MIAIGFDPGIAGFGLSDGARHDLISTQAGVPMLQRADTIVVGIHGFVRGRGEMLWCVEGPSFGNAGASFVWDHGYLMARIDLLAREYQARLIVVPPSTLKKWVTGKGNTPKAQMALRVFRKWGIEIENDPRLDKLLAYCLHRYGVAVLAGEHVHEETKPRGQGNHATLGARRTARTKAGVA